jgi:phage terminase small subunit
MNENLDAMTQAGIFGDGICTVCGKDVEPSLCNGKLVVLMWCSADCTRVYASRWMTDKQAVFFEEYLVDLNGTQAAIRAGYSAKTANRIASENMSKHVIKQAISLAMAERSMRTKITATKVLTDIEMIKQNAMQTYANGKHMIEHGAALKACELQGRHLKMFVDKVEVEVVDKLAERLQRAREREKSRD